MSCVVCPAVGPPSILPDRRPERELLEPERGHATCAQEGNATCQDEGEATIMRPLPSVHGNGLEAERCAQLASRVAAIAISRTEREISAAECFFFCSGPQPVGPRVLAPAGGRCAT